MRALALALPALPSVLVQVRTRPPDLYRLAPGEPDAAELR